MNEKFKYNKVINKNNCVLNISYIGDIKNKIDVGTITNKANSLLENIDISKDLSHVIIWIRNTFKNIDERKLLVDYKNTTQDFIIEYEDKVIKKYASAEIVKEKDGKKAILKSKFNRDQDLSFSISDLDNLIQNDHFIENNIGIISKELHKISKLKNCSNIDLSYNEKLICEIYKFFYREYPNFSNEDIHIKINAMLSIIRYFDIDVGLNYAFRLTNFCEVPVDINLMQEVQLLRPLGKIEYIDNKAILDKNIEQEIAEIGDIVYDNENDLNKLINISKNIRDQYENQKTYDLESFKLIKKIKTKIKK